MEPKRVSSWQVRAEAGEPFAVVRVRDLQSTIKAGTDAWGREGKTQPVVVSAELSMSEPFEAASLSDKVSDDTVHYGLLAKALLRILDNVNRYEDDVSLENAMQMIWNALTGYHVSGSEADGLKEPAFLKDKLPKIRYLNITLALPKASLLGSSVSRSYSLAHGFQNGTQAGAFYSSSLRINDLRVPTLIGVNDNERLARQIVAVSVEIEGYQGRSDSYVEIESFVVKVCYFSFVFFTFLIVLHFVCIWVIADSSHGTKRFWATLLLKRLKPSVLLSLGVSGASTKSNQMFVSPSAIPLSGLSRWSWRSRLPLPWPQPHVWSTENSLRQSHSRNHLFF